VQRDPSLVPLSRDHHVALQLAEGLKRDGPEALRAVLPQTLEGRIAHVLAFIAEHLAPHFAVEEDVVFPAVGGRDRELDAIIGRVLAEHARMRGIFRKLESGAGLEDDLDALGRALAGHVRLEERELFVRIEAVVPAADLEALARLTERPRPR
jgi:iron-sulfur cluster repair protein YtfE (RIC family)